MAKNLLETLKEHKVGVAIVGGLAVLAIAGLLVCKGSCKGKWKWCCKKKEDCEKQEKS